MPEGNKKHLQVSREQTINERRSGRTPRFANRDNLPSHGQKIRSSFKESFSAIANNKSSHNDSLVVKVKYEDALDFNSLSVHGIDFISQEGSNLFVGFIDREGLKTFLSHLNSMKKGDKVSYIQVLKAFESVGAWGAEDKKSWAIKNGTIPEDEFRLDVEIWPVGGFNSLERRKYRDSILSKFEKLNVKVIDSINLDSLLMYRVSLDKDAYEALLEDVDVRLIDFTPKSGISYQSKDVALDDLPSLINSPPENAPKICILDSGINASHPLLSPAMAESESFVASGSINDEAGHGTQVAGIALYGDLEERLSSNYWVPEFWLYNGRILDENCEFDLRTIEKTLINAVEYFVGLGCKIFNLSIGNSNAPYEGKHIRGMAYVLDELSRKHDILFVVSTGNFTGNNELEIPKNSWRDEYPEYLLCDHNCIIDPAPSLNSITVGGLAKHNATDDAQRRPDEISHLAAANKNQPSPFTRRGPSVKGAIKPDLMAYAGNYACSMRFEGTQWQAIPRGMGVLTCNHNFLSNTLLTEVSGTSFSAPYITHLAAKVLKEYPTASANLLRCLLLSQSEDVIECESTFNEKLTNEYVKKHGARRLPKRDVSGLGTVYEDNLYRSSEDVVVLMAEETIQNDCCQFFEIPIPEDYLRKGNASREIKVALSYMPAVKTTRIDYRASKISFNLISGDSLEDVERYYNKLHQSELATLGDSISDKRRQISGELRSKGTGQVSRWKFKRLNATKKWFIVVTRQDSYGWGKDISEENEKYSIVVTITDRENEEANLYTQISQRITERAREKLPRVRL